MYFFLSYEKNYLDVISTKDKADIQNKYDEYVTYGAFPELVEIKNKRAFLNSIYQTVYLGDIITRNKITKCILITNSEEAILDYDGINIEVIPIWKWLLEKDHKNKML